MFQIQSTAASLPDSVNFVKTKSVWVECREDPGFVAKCFECDRSLSLLTKSANKENEGNSDDDERMVARLQVRTAFNLQYFRKHYCI